MTDNIYERLQAIETRLDSLEGRAGAQQTLLLRQQKALSDLEAKVDTEANIREEQANAIGRWTNITNGMHNRMLKLKEDLHNHDARLSDLEGEDRKVVLEGPESPVSEGLAAIQKALDDLRNVHALLEDFYGHDYTYEDLSRKLDASIKHLSDLLGFPR